MAEKNKHCPLTSRRSRSGLFSCMALLALLLATGLHAAPLESFLLFYSNNIQGETEPCG